MGKNLIEMEDFLADFKKQIAEIELHLDESWEEINMWRNKFLISRPTEEPLKNAVFIWNAFLFIPSDKMLEITPETLYESLRKKYEN